MKLFTQVQTEKLSTGISLNDKVMVLGSCFADNIGERLQGAGFNVMVNPFGTLYNPSSIFNAIWRLDSGIRYVPGDCVEMGAGAGLICSFEHHTSFARADAETFLDNANRSLDEASAFWKTCNKVMITLGTAMVWNHGGKIVANCLKRPAAEFTHDMLPVDAVRDTVAAIIAQHPDKDFIFTVSPIRHLGDGAHANNLSKATLHLALSQCGGFSYFPAFEILNDELRDYRFYAEDLVHPSRTAVDIIWERFLESAVPASELAAIRENEKAARLSAHRPLR